MPDHRDESTRFFKFLLFFFILFLRPSDLAAFWGMANPRRFAPDGAEKGSEGCANQIEKNMRDIQNEAALHRAIRQGAAMAERDTAYRTLIQALQSFTEKELVENLEEWANEFRQSQHGATLTILRVLRKIRDAKDALEKLASTPTPTPKD